MKSIAFWKITDRGGSVSQKFQLKTGFFLWLKFFLCCQMCFFSLKPGSAFPDGRDQARLVLENIGCRSSWLPDLLARTGNMLAKAFKQDIAAQLENLAPELIKAESGSQLTVDVKRYADAKEWRLTPQHLGIEADSDRLMVSCELGWKK